MTEIARGDRNRLTGAELHKLDMEVIPTALRWVRDFPMLADHGRQTLSYWGVTAPGNEPSGPSVSRP